MRKYVYDDADCDVYDNGYANANVYVYMYAYVCVNMGVGAYVDIPVNADENKKTAAVV